MLDLGKGAMTSHPTLHFTSLQSTSMNWKGKQDGFWRKGLLVRKESKSINRFCSTSVNQTWTIICFLGEKKMSNGVMDLLCSRGRGDNKQRRKIVIKWYVG